MREEMRQIAVEAGARSTSLIYVDVDIETAKKRAVEKGIGKSRLVGALKEKKDTLDVNDPHDDIFLWDSFSEIKDHGKKIDRGIDR